MVPVEAQRWEKTELVHHSAERNGGKVECHLKDVKGHDSRTLFQLNGLALKQGEEFSHSFNVKQIMY